MNTENNLYNDVITPLEQEVKKAFAVILNDKKAKTLNYCIDYTAAGLEMTGEELRIQCLYILNNMVYWRHPEAKRIRQLLKEAVKSL